MKARNFVLDVSIGEARSQAIAYIGISHKSSGKVSDYLVRKGFSRETAADVISGLISDGYIDDLRVARSLMQVRRGRKAEAKRALLLRMRQAGISECAIAEAEQIIPEDEDTIAELLDGKVMPELQRQLSQDSFDADVWMNKAVRFLISRGYSSTLSLDTLRKWIRDVK